LKTDEEIEKKLRDEYELNNILFERDLVDI